MVIESLLIGLYTFGHRAQSHSKKPTGMWHRVYYHDCSGCIDEHDSALSGALSVMAPTGLNGHLVFMTPWLKITTSRTAVMLGWIQNPVIGIEGEIIGVKVEKFHKLKLPMNR
jgi:hypothetical protein